MAEISPVLQSGYAFPVYVWSGVSAGDTLRAISPPVSQSLAGSVQVEGLSDSTFALTASNDGSNFYTILDRFGATISELADGLFDFDTGAMFLAPSLTGGTDTGVVITVVLRG